MVILAAYNKSAPVLILAALFIFFVMGLLVPVYDFLKLRRRARFDSTPMPGMAILFQELLRSQLLAVFLFLAGTLTVLAGTLGLLDRDRLSAEKSLKMSLVIVLGFVLVFASQSISRRYKLWSRSWRAKIPNEPNAKDT